MDPLTDLGVEVTTSFLAKLKKHFAYLYKYKHNLIELEEAKRQLDAKRIDAIKFSGQIGLSVKDIGNTVQLWQSDAENLDRKAETLISRNNISCLNMWSRYSTSKHAWELTQMINEKVKSAPDFGMSFDRSVAEGAKFNLRGDMEFESRRRIQNEVMEALRRDDVTMCSICGMGGIGKTTLAKKLVKKVEADGLFDKVAMVTVSQNPNFEEIQKGLIDSLGLKFEESTLQGRAKRLNDWLSNHRTLLILDDVWWQLSDENFDDLGVPLANNRCKIVFTSRNIDECMKMGSDPNFPLNVLDVGEALELFIQNAGKCVEERNWLGKARQIVDECRGLPIVIVTIAKALKDAPNGEWDDSLAKLQKSNLLGISDMEKVYSKIQVSYNLLKDPEVQSCLRLCCLFPEDYNVPIEKLVFYGKGLELFKGVESLKEARNRVDSIVHKLKSSFLLLDGDEDGCVKLHDIVRDFAIWISSKDENPYLVISEKEMEKWPENCQYEKCSAISFVCKRIKNHPVGLRCPNLKLLQLQFEYGSDELPNGFFDGMEELRVVNVDVRSKLPPLAMQKALRTLLVTRDSLVDCSNLFREMLGEGGLMNLEIISLPWMIFSEFPMEIGLMRNLRCLRCYGGFFENIPLGVLSNLVQLEELELPLSFSDWGLEKNGRSNASLDEIGSLPLTSITIGLQEGSILPENIVRSITRFRIHIGRIGFQDFDFYSNLLVVRDVDECDTLVEWTSSLLRKCQKLDLVRVGLKYIMSQRLGEKNCYKTKCFSHLKTLDIRWMHSLEEILHGTYSSNIQQPCFSNLTDIVIQGCQKLNRAFPMSVAREFTQLKFMELEDCREMEEVFYDDQVDSGNQNMGASIEKVGGTEVDHVVVLPRLRKFYLRGMPKLRVLNENHAIIECPSLDELMFDYCGGMEHLCYESKQLVLVGRLGDLKNISKWLPFAQENGTKQIKGLRIAKFHDIKCLADAIESPNLLKTLFSCLEYLSIGDMDSLEEIWHGPYLPKTVMAQCFSTLIVLRIYDCPKMKHLFPLPLATELRQLQVMSIQSCKEIEEIFYNDHVDDGNQILEEIVGKRYEREVDHVIVWPRLRELYLYEIPKLRVMYNGNHTIECPSLEELSINECNNMEGLSNGSFSAPITKKLVLIGVTHWKSISERLHFEQDNGIPQLQVLQIESCHEMIYLVNARTDQNLLKTFFSSLIELWIERMDRENG